MAQNPPLHSGKMFGIMNFVLYDYVSNIAGRLQKHLIYKNIFNTCKDHSKNTYLK